MDAPKRTRSTNRTRPAASPQPQRLSRQIVVAMTQDEYDRCWHDPVQLRILLDQRMEAHPELFPECLRYGYAFHGMARPSRKLGGWRLRKIRATGSREAFHLRPSFILPYMTGTIEDVEKVLFLASFGVPCWALTKVFGRDSMYWQRLIERLGRNSLVGTTVRDPERLPEHLAADEHHVDWSGEKGYVAMTVGGGCILGVALTDSADEERLTAAYGEFAAEAREVKADYAPKTVNTDGWFATQNAFRACFSTIVVILCFLHGFLKIRDRCRKDRALHERVWKVYCSSTAAEFDQRMREFGQWFDSLEWTKPVREAVAKLRARTAEYAMAYDSPGCARTSNAVDRPMNRLRRLAYAGRGIHGHQASSQRRLRGWALLLNFRPFARRGRQDRPHQSPAHRLNEKLYSNHWLENLMISASLMGHRNPAPAIR